MQEQTASTQDDGPVGIGGWLLLLCIGLTIIGPLLAVLSLVLDYQQLAQLSLEEYSRLDNLPKLQALIYISGVFTIGLSIFGVYCGVRLWGIRPSAVKLTKDYLVWLLVWNLISCFLLYMTAPSSETLTAAIASATPGFLSFGIWYSYLNQSERVRNTFRQMDGTALPSRADEPDYDVVRACPACDAPYKLSDYRPDATLICCSSCHEALPQSP
jgi:hypothetical protein